MKLVLAPNHFLIAQSTASNFTSSVVNMLEKDVAAIQINYTGAPSGTLAVRGSVDGVNYANVYVSVNGAPPSATIAVPANASPILIDLVGTSIPNLEIVWTGSGAGTMDGYTSTKRLGD